MSLRAQLTFVPSLLVPAGGSFALWTPEATDDGGGASEDAGRASDGDDGASDDPLEAAAHQLGLPVGEPGRLATFEIHDQRAVPVDRAARLMPVLPVVRRLAAMPPGADWPAWSRPSASVLGWSVAAKLGLELVAAGRILPDMLATDRPTQGRARWRVAVPGDARPAALAAALPVAAYALRDEADEPWVAVELVHAFLDAVADTCGRAGRRPEIDPRRRGPRRPFAEMWLDALGGSDPTVDHLRVPVQELVDDVADWAAPLVGRDRRATARLAVRIELPDIPGESSAQERLVASDAPWRLRFLLQSTSDATQRISASEVWARPGRAVELGDRRVEDAASTLTRGLAHAARLYPPIERALLTSAPDELELDAAEAAALLADGVDALTAGGIAVEMPPELRDAGDRRLRLRVRIGRSTTSAPRVEQDSPLGLRALTDLRYEVALGDDTLSEEELAQIVALGQPLVRWRGRWVRVDRDEADRIAALSGEGTSLELTEALAAALSGQHHVEDVGWVETVADGA
ncbi:MAG: SNF2 helicase-associated domain-containing protein, partial [Nitriliruptoraceae bacterium]|nr:SNF2 helicase-associated domain-containing protein [Nitriliruptoraceae bacterium]